MPQYEAVGLGMGNVELPLLLAFVLPHPLLSLVFRLLQVVASLLIIRKLEPTQRSGTHTRSHLNCSDRIDPTMVQR